MTRERLEQLCTEGGEWLNKFYNRAVYHLGEKPWLFWIGFALAGYGAVRVVW